MITNVFEQLRRIHLFHSLSATSPQEADYLSKPVTRRFPDTHKSTDTTDIANITAHHTPVKSRKGNLRGICRLER